jgi:hypothetical protein
MAISRIFSHDGSDRLALFWTAAFAQTKRFGFILAIGAALIFVQAISRVNAATLTYKFDPGTSFSFADGGTGDLKGTFTIDPPSNSFSAEDLVITGGAEAGSYAPYYNDSGKAQVYLGVSGSIEVLFSSILNLAPEHPMLVGVSAMTSEATSVTGGATLSVAEPSTWAMLLLGFVGLGYGSHRKARRAAVA